MTFVPAPNVVMVEERGLLDGQFVENRFYVNVLHEPTSADLIAIASAMGTVITTEWVPILPTTWSLREQFMRSMHEENAVQLTFPVTPGTVVGENGNAQLPNNCTLCVSLRSSFAGRSARGRFYWPALHEAQVVGNTVNTSDAADIVQAVQAIDVQLSAIGYDLIICSFITNGAPRVGGPVYFSVNSIFVTDFVVDSQRRRLPGRGR
jgi:hypothetical protein